MSSIPVKFNIEENFKITFKPWQPVYLLSIWSFKMESITCFWGDYKLKQFIIYFNWDSCVWKALFVLYSCFHLKFLIF